MTDLASAPAAPEPVASTPEPAAPAPETSSAPEPAAEAAPTPEVSRKASIERAFAKLDAEEAPKPEPKAEEKPADGPARGPDGRFVASEPKAPEAPVGAKPAEQPKAPEAKSPIAEPPSRFSADAKAAWAQAPEAVRGEIHRAVRELEQGLAKKDAQLAPLKPFAEMAERSGSSLPAVLAGMANLHQTASTNIVKGLDQFARTYGVTLEQVARHVMGQPANAQQDAKDRHIAQLEQRLAQMEGRVGQVTQTVQQQREQATMAEVTRFAEAHPHLEDLATDIAAILRAEPGLSLKDAYDRALERAKQLAARLIPPPPPPTPPQPRPSLSVTGAPTAGSNPAQRAPSKTRNEAIERALRATGLA